MKTISTARPTRKRAARAARAKSKLRQLRDGANLVVRDVARLTGISAATISRVENGYPPDIRTALRLAQFYEATVEDLLGNFK